ncbi:MAG: TetR/AcrR family transcriptional regulator [Brevefilum sp.]|nr:TetR/AcrR family transcriptional regulator [Brevefilum sp.]
MTTQRRSRKEAILQVATEHFARHGFHGATLSAIAEAVGLTEPGLLYYFPSKVELLQGVLDYRDQADKSKYMAILEQDKISLFSALQDLVNVNQERPGLVQLFTVMVGESINPEHPSHDFFVQRYRALRKTMVDFFKTAAVSEGYRTDVDLEQLVVLIIAVLDGLQIQWLLDPGQVEMTTGFALFTRLVETYLEKEPSD